MPGSPGRSSAKGRWRSGEVVGMAAIGGGVVEAEGELIDVAPVPLHVRAGGGMSTKQRKGKVHQSK